MTYFSIWYYQPWRVYLQSSMLFIGRIISRTKNIRPGILSLVLWYVDFTAKAADTSIPIHGSAPSTSSPCRLYVRTRFPSTWCILSMISFFCLFLGGDFLVLISYSFSIKIFLNLWPRNSPLQSYVISTSHGYRTSHIVSTKLAMVISLLSLYCAI